MILVEIRTGGDKQTIAVHPAVTVIGGLDAAARRTWTTELAGVLKGQPSGSLEVEVEIDGRRQVLSPQLVQQLGLGDAASAVTVFAVDLPGARLAEAADDAVAEAAPAPDPAEGARDLVALEAAVATDEARVGRLQTELEAAERAATSAADELTAAGRRTDRDADAAVQAAEARLEAARAAAASARSELQAAEEGAGAASAEAVARSSESSARVDQLQAQLATLESERAATIARVVGSTDRRDPAPVAEALAALRRLRSVKPKPSPRALELADRWAAVLEQLGTLPQPPQPPEWLVTPALAALHEARAAVAEATSGARPEPVDPAQVEALDRAHREVLEAEQRAMKKGSRLNRRRLDAAHEAEQAALAALGVASYGDYLQRIAPALEGSGSNEERLAAARASLADAEAVWEELHGGQASPEWTAVKEQQAEIRNESLALLGREVEDHELEDQLRAHLETVVDTEWAEQELAGALRQAGVATSSGDDLEAAADRWLANLPDPVDDRQALEAELSELDGRLAAVEEQLAEAQADAFFGDEPPVEETRDNAGGGGRAAGRANDALAALRAEAVEAEAAEADADTALVAARERRAASAQDQTRLRELEAAADARRGEVDRIRASLDEAEAAARTTRAAVTEASAGTTTKPPTPQTGAPPVAEPPGVAAPAVDLSGVVGMEAEAYLLARVASLRGASGGPLPLVVDADALSGLSEGAGRRVLRLLGRLGGSMQIVVVGGDDDDRIATWAEGLGDQAAVRQAAAR